MDGRQFGSRWIQLVNSGDLAGLREMVAARAVATAPGGVNVSGREAVMQYLGTSLSAFQDGRLEVESVILAEDWVVHRYVFTGTHTAALHLPPHEIPATGNRVRVRCVSLLRHQRGLCLENHTYFDQAEVMSQLGVMPPLLATTTATPPAPATPRRRAR